MATYWEKLRDPRWQRKRLEIMQRGNFACEMCGESDVTLNVHHGYYEKGLDPWEYEDKTLWCLCEPCHEHVQERLRDIHREIAMIWPEMIDAAMHAVMGLWKLGPGELAMRIVRERNRVQD